MKIGVFSCSSFSCKQCPNRAKNAINFLKEKGHTIIIGKLFNNINDNYRSGNILERAEEFNELLEKKCDLYISAIGGYCSNSIVPFINYKIITKKMIFVGNSDATPILINISQKTKAKVIYGPSLITHFGEWEKEYSNNSYNQLISCINNKQNIIKVFENWTDDYKNWNNFEESKNKNKNKIEFIGESIIRGNLLPINLNSFSTIYNKNIKIKNNTILFLEDSQKDIAQIEKLFSFLIHNKILKKVKALILGKYEQFNDLNSKKLPHNVLFEILEVNKLKIKNFVYYIDCGHTHPTNSLIFNKKITIDFDNKKIWQ